MYDTERKATLKKNQNIDESNVHENKRIKWRSIKGQKKSCPKKSIFHNFEMSRE